MCLHYTTTLLNWIMCLHYAAAQGSCKPGSASAASGAAKSLPQLNEAMLPGDPAGDGGAPDADLAKK